MLAVRDSLAGCGTATDALSFGGYTGADVNRNEKWGSDVWLTVGTMNQARNTLAGCGTTSAALSFGGVPNYTTTEIWDGSAWHTTSSLNDNSKNQASGCGLTSGALSFGGYQTNNVTEKWDGDSWHTDSSLNTG